MRNCLTYEIVHWLAAGQPVQNAGEQTLHCFSQRLQQQGQNLLCVISLIAQTKDGHWDAATNVDFAFCAASADQEAGFFYAKPEEEHIKITPITAQRLAAYQKSTKKTN